MTLRVTSDRPRNPGIEIPVIGEITLPEPLRVMLSKEQFHTGATGIVYPHEIAAGLLHDRAVAEPVENYRVIANDKFIQIARTDCLHITGALPELRVAKFGYDMDTGKVTSFSLHVAKEVAMKYLDGFLIDSSLVRSLVMLLRPSNTNPLEQLQAPRTAELADKKD